MKRIVQLHFVNKRQCTSIKIQQDIRKLGKSPIDFLIGQKLLEFPTKPQAQQFKQEFGVDILHQDDFQISNQVKKTQNYIYPNKQYQQQLIKYPHGKVNIFDYKDTHFTLVGTQYQNLPIKNIYKLISYSKPDLILLQIRPDQILSNFTVQANSQETNAFSSKLYYTQLEKTGFEVMPSHNLRLQVKQNLKQNNILLESVKDINPEYYQNIYKPTIQNKKFKEYTHLERLSDFAIATACFYAERNNIPVVLCDIPEIVFRQNIANEYSLMQLQNIFTRLCRTLAQNPDITPNTPLNMANQMFPEDFLNRSDKYISTLIEFIIALKKYPRITCFLGHGQSQSVQEYLFSRKVSHLADELKVNPPKGTVLRDPSCEELVEKHALLDVLYWGKDILKNIQQKQFKVAYEIIHRYADPENVERERYNKMIYLHAEMIKKYAKFAQQEFNEGKQLLQKEFLIKMGH